MADEWKEIANQALDIFKSSLKDFVDRQDVDQFAKERLEQYAKEWWASRTAATDTERAEHSANLVHLVAQARGEARRLQIAISSEAKDMIGRILETVGGALVKLAPTLLSLIK
jgi:hypothetical protein